MKLSKLLIVKIIFVFFSSQLLFNVSKVKAAEEIKIVYSLFSRTIQVDSLKKFAQEAKSTKKLRKIFKCIYFNCPRKYAVYDFNFFRRINFRNIK